MASESDVQALRGRRPSISGNEALKIARHLYGVEGSVSELPSERDQNFHIGDYVLKIAPSTEERSVLEFQNEAISRIGVPRVVPTRNGELIAEVQGHCVRLLTFLPGTTLGNHRPHTPDLLKSIGRLMARVDVMLEGWSHPAADRELYWNIKNAAEIISMYKHYVEDTRRRAIVESFLDRWNQQASPLLASLRTGIIHNDANDHNVIVGSNGSVAVIDFGDMLRTYSVAEIAITAAYVMLAKPDPITAASHVIAGYNEVRPLTETELEVLYHFICMRLCMSVTIAAHQKQLEPGNDYLTVSEQPAWQLIEQLAGIHPRLAHYSFRAACGLPACPKTARILDHLRRMSFARVVDADLNSSEAMVIDLSIDSVELAAIEGTADTAQVTEYLFSLMKAKGARVGIGRYDEARGVYTSELFKSAGNDGPEWRTVHLGIDLFMSAGSPVFAPVDGFVHSFRNNDALLDYGPTIILRHPIPDGEFYTLYGHLSLDSLNGLEVGMPVHKGTRFASIGNFPDNGNWSPHVHFQIVADMLDRDGEFPGVATPGKRNLWLSLSPDANLILRISSERFPKPDPSPEHTLSDRRRSIGPSLSLSYKTPLKIVRGYKQYLYDQTGRSYLDCVNNVAHVGHSHPRVVRAAQNQMTVLNTNTRYLHDNIVEYARRLCAKLPASLSVCFFVNSGSEANDLALRLARAYTKTIDTIVVEGAYHGNLTSLVEISPYKFDGPGGRGAPAHVRKVSIRQEEFRNAVRGPAAFIVESILSCAGQLVLPTHYLDESFKQVRAAGGVCISDEVQVGFGRVGSHFWAFETQCVVPDIVTMGKPIGNGHPLGAVVTTPEIAASFNAGMEYFNTFGGNPVSCAVGLAVLDVIQDENLQQNALEVGEYLKGQLSSLVLKHSEIADVRGFGLFLGIELIRPDDASYIVERMKTRGILLSLDGPLHNVIKIKPPLVFNKGDAGLLVETLDDILNETVIKRRS